MRVEKRFENHADRLRFFLFTSFRVRMTAVDAGVGHIARFWP